MVGDAHRGAGRRHHVRAHPRQITLATDPIPNPNPIPNPHPTPARYVFILEMGLKLLGMGWLPYWADKWNQLDGTIVSMPLPYPYPYPYPYPSPYPYPYP